MKRLLTTFAVLTVVVMQYATAAPVGLDIGLEAGVADIPIEEDREFYVQPEIGYAIGDTGLRSGFAWEIPLLPQAEIGTLEGWLEYEILIPRLLLTFGNNTALILESTEFEGYVYTIGEYSLGNFTLELEVDFGYVPEFLIDAIPGLSFDADLGPGSLGIGISQNVTIYDEFGRGDTEFFVSYETTLGGFGITFEVEPMITDDGEFTLSVISLFEYYL
jgi:hypothetical protein